MAQPSGRAVDCSIVIPVYYNEGSLAPTMESIRREVIEKNPRLTFEAVFVDDGSGDASLNELIALHKADPRTIRVVKLSRNFGQVNALLAGFARARGRCVVAMSADEQDPPELINDMIRSHFDEHYDIVVCTRMGRDESWYRAVTSKIFYLIMKRLTFPEMPLGGFDYVLLGRRPLEALLKQQEAHMFFQGMILSLGFRKKFIPYQRQERRVGRSRWTFGKKLTYLIDGVLSFSFQPIRFMSLVGGAVAVIAFLYALVVVVRKLLYWNQVELGWTPLMAVMLFMGGVQMLMLGILGEYLWRTLAQVRKRELYIIEETYDDDGADSV